MDLQLAKHRFIWAQQYSPLSTPELYMQLATYMHQRRIDNFAASYMHAMGFIQFAKQHNL